MIPFGSIVIPGSNPQAFSPTATPSKLNVFTGNGASSSASEGDQSVQPDHANSQILVYKPGNYLVMFQAIVQADGEQPADFYLYANGSKVADLGAQVTFKGSQYQPISFWGLYQATKAFTDTSLTDALTIYVASDDYNGNDEDLTIASAALLVMRMS
jgi:hypothetical protein